MDDGTARRGRDEAATSLVELTRWPAGRPPKAEGLPTTPSRDMVRLSANLSFLFKDRPFLSRFRAAADHGFTAVEWLFAGEASYEHTAAEVHSELHAFGLEQALFNAPAGDWAAGERGLGGLRDRDAEWESSIETGLEYAAALRCPNLHVMAGLRQHGADEDTFVRRLVAASDEAARAGVSLLVEPLNARDFPGYLVPDWQAALRILARAEALGAPPRSCRLQLDFYHLYVQEELSGQPLTTDDAAFLVRKLLPHAGHVQLADPDGRTEPSAAVGHFAPLLELLDAQGYGGHVGCEYKPSGPPHVALAWAERYGVKPMGGVAEAWMSSPCA